jgi:hypothetical protein
MAQDVKKMTQQIKQAEALHEMLLACLTAYQRLRRWIFGKPTLARKEPVPLLRN